MALHPRRQPWNPWDVGVEQVRLNEVRDAVAQQLRDVPQVGCRCTARHLCLWHALNQVLVEQGRELDADLARAHRELGIVD